MISNASGSLKGNESQHFDAIVIGSGIGSLATASILAQVGKKRVLVLESHFKLGGFLHSFKRDNYEWDPGLHYIGEMQDGALTRQCMDLVTGGQVKFHQLKDGFERMIFPEGTFSYPNCPKRLRASLIERFPDEEKSIKRYFKDMSSILNWSHRWYFSKQFSGVAASLLGYAPKLAGTVTQKYFDERFKSSLLKAILLGQWPDYGTPPDSSALGVHCMVSGDFLNGGYYPVGGSQKIADAAQEKIEEFGGRCLVSHPVERVLVNDNKACGVEVSRKGQTLRFTAPMVISGAGVRTTFQKLVSEEWGQQERQKVENAEPGTSSLILFLGLNDDPTKHGFNDCNYWVFRGTNHNLRPEKAKHAPIRGAFLSFGSLRNPGQTPHVAQIVTFSDDKEWDEFHDSKWKNAETNTRRSRSKGRKISDFVEARCPGLRPLIAYRELSSPLSVKTFTGHPFGQIYGSPCTPNRIKRETSWTIGTSIKDCI